MDSIENRVDKLETLCSQMNSNINSLQGIVDALQNKDYVTKVEPVVDNNTVIGYTVFFTKSDPITIYHGKDGSNGSNGVDGKDGHSPIVSVRQDEDGQYYWVLDGAWLLDSNGNKLRASAQDGAPGKDGADGNDGSDGVDGKDGITPQLKIEDGNWFLSCDSGNTWSCIGKATGDAGDSFFSSVDTSDETYVVFTLADGTTFSLPKYSSKVLPTSIVVLTDSVKFKATSSDITFEFRVNPSNAEFEYKNGGDVQLDLVVPGTKADVVSYVTEPSNYSIKQIEPSLDSDGNIKQGQYKVTIHDNGFSSSYNDRVALVLNTTDYQCNPVLLSSTLFNVSITLDGTSIYGLTVSSKDGSFVQEALGVSNNQVVVCVPYGTDCSDLVVSVSTDCPTIIANGNPFENGKSSFDFVTKGKSFKTTTPDGATARTYVVKVYQLDLPALFIQMPDDKDIVSKYDWMSDGIVRVWNPNDGSIDEVGTVSARGRGNTTWGFPKKPYALKLDSKAKLLGMSKDKRWDLISNWMDRTNLRNYTAGELARQTSLEWTPKGEFCEFFLNGFHRGQYYLMEHIKASDKRLNIKTLNATDEAPELISGGYILEFDVNYDDVNKFRSPVLDLPINIKEPDDDVLNKTQFDYIRNYIGTVEDLLTSSDTPDPSYVDYIDIDSYIDWWMVNELAENNDPAFPKSGYMYKDRDSKLKAGPIWDFDWGTFTTWGVQGFIHTQRTMWYPYLFRDDAFRVRVKERWNETKDKFLSVIPKVESKAKILEHSELLDHELWPLDKAEKNNGDETLSYDEAVAQLIATLKSRIEWMDSAINSL